MPSRLPALLTFASSALACSTPNGAPADGGADRVPDVADGARGDSAKHDAADVEIEDAGPARLVALSVTGGSLGDASPPIELVPRFSPKIFDYYVRCAQGLNVLTISMTASPGAEALLTSPTASRSAPKQTLVEGLEESEAIVAVATDRRSSQEYWVRCLPHDFPHLEMSLHPETGAPTPGYYLVGNQLVRPDEGCYAMVLDGHGVPVWYARLPPGASAEDTDAVVPGAISFGYPFQIRSLSPPSTRNVTAYGLPTDQHELRVLPNGDLVAFWTLVESGYDLTGVVLPLPDGGSLAFGPDSNILGCDIVEIDPAGDVVWAWVATQHFDPSTAIAFFAPPVAGPDGGLLADPFHCNSLDVDDNGNFLVSGRSMSSVFYIEKATGKVLWKMGGSDTSSELPDKPVYVPVADRFVAQHDARLQPGWKDTCSGRHGQISVFDDQTDRPTPARGVVYDVEIGSGDGGAPGDCGVGGDAGKTGAEVAWQYKGSVSTIATGSFRILPDGSRIIGWGSNPNVAFTEVDVAGDDLLDFHFTDTETTYRAIKVPLDAFSLSDLRHNAGH